MTGGYGMNDLKRIFILPGELVISRVPAEIATLLGSCVAVCLFNKKGKFGGMNHYMLPTGNNPSLNGKYGDKSIEKLISSMLKVDPIKSNIVAKMYGGGAVVGHLSSGSGANIGQKNIMIAKTMLDDYAIRVVDKKVGGTDGMKIFFNNQTGDVRVTMIQKSALTKQLEEKKKDLVGRKIRVLIVDDSSTVRSILRRALSADPEIHVVGEAENAFDARNKILELDPDVITLDIIMPKLDGVSFLKKLMVYYPKPVIIVSSVAQKGSKMRLRADEIGAVEVLDKEDLKLYQGIETVTRLLAPKIKMAAIKIVGKKEIDQVKNI